MLGAGSDLLVGAAELLHGIGIGPSAYAARSAVAAELSASLTSSGTAVTVPRGTGRLLRVVVEPLLIDAGERHLRPRGESARLTPRPLPDAAPVTNAASPAGPFLLLRSLVYRRSGSWRTTPTVDRGIA
ncbi:hypothetical protein R2F25_00465 [Streptomyces sp. UP1A-1]|nr:hypothetical protein [Streptomyces sp. UP1A-1]